MEGAGLVDVLECVKLVMFSGRSKAWQISGRGKVMQVLVVLECVKLQACNIQWKV